MSSKKYSLALPLRRFHCLGSRAGWETRLTHVIHVILSSVRCLVKVLRVHNVFLGSHLRLTAIVPSQLHRQTIDASMAASLWADDVSTIPTYNYLLSIADRS
jgi:hypothetical protein